ncbi:DeoR/GlpR family DNA-binding transcription regulator [Jiella sp. M17.18]|uniref:DeoR/GlpR family DNA-binding transcription regulator n=1 Tax=Jiella sp. M17.18 TaxID=3234247 RepID=UPI0034DFE049
MRAAACPFGFPPQQQVCVRKLQILAKDVRLCHAWNHDQQPCDGRMSDRSSNSRVEILPAQRRALILERLRIASAASIQDLAAVLGASSSTVRRDLDYLTERGYIERTHGGAVIPSVPTTRFEPEASIAAETARGQKAAIATIAARRLSPGQSVLFDASSTVRETARVISGLDIPLTAVTNDIACALLLSNAPAIHTIVAGGAIRPGSTTLVGSPGQEFLHGIHVDIAFIGVHAISGDTFTETSLEVAAMKKRMIAAAHKVIVLADSSKFGGQSFCEICAVGAVDEIVTDDRLPDATRREYEAMGVKLTLAPSE